MYAFDMEQGVGCVGQVKQVKVLGGLALNDGGETDWMMLVIDVEDPIAPLVDSWKDVEKYRPGVASAYLEWFHESAQLFTHKNPRGDGYLQIIGDLYQNASYSAEQIAESHEFWQELVAGDVDTNGINYSQTTAADLDSYVSIEHANDELDLPTKSDVEDAADVPEEALVWWYLDGNYGIVDQGNAGKSSGPWPVEMRDVGNMNTCPSHTSASTQ